MVVKMEVEEASSMFTQELKQANFKCLFVSNV